MKLDTDELNPFSINCYQTEYGQIKPSGLQITIQWLTTRTTNE